MTFIIILINSLSAIIIVFIKMGSRKFYFKIKVIILTIMLIIIIFIIMPKINFEFKIMDPKFMIIRFIY